MKVAVSRGGSGMCDRIWTKNLAGFVGRTEKDLEVAS